MPTTIYTPVNGISTDTNRQVLYLSRPDGSIAQMSVTSVLSPQEIEQANRSAGGALGAVQLAWQRLQQEYGLSVQSLPTVNRADLDQRLMASGKIAPNGVARYDVASINDFVTAQPAQLQPSQINTDPSIQGHVNPNQNFQTQGSSVYSPPPTQPSGQIDPQSGLPLVNPNQAFQTASSAAPYNPSSSTSGTSSSTPGGTAQGPDLSNLPPEFQGLYTQLQTYLEELKKRGQVLNPAIEITPAKAAEFLNQAKAEIDPYYQNQVKLALDSLSTAVSQGQEDLVRTEGRAETTYQDNLRTLGESAADRGFAQSGLRNRDEQTLATNTQNTLDDARRSFARGVGDLSRSFAQTYGASKLPQFNINGAPIIGAGENRFAANTRQLPMYQLSPEVYSGLTGSQEYQNRADVLSRASQLEGAYRTNEALNQQRQLLL